MLRGHDGQAAVEFLAVVPLLLTAGLIAWQLVLAGHSAWVAAHAARAGARADLVGEDPARAARSALPRSLRHGLSLERRARGGVAVRVPVGAIRRAWRGRVAIGARTSLEAVP